MKPHRRMTTARFRCASLLCLITAQGATIALAAESWRAFPTEAKNVLFSVDEASLVRKGDVVKFWERLVYVVPEQRDEASGKMVKEKRVHRIMNCKDKTQAHVYASQIAEDGKRIEEVYREEAKVEMTPIRPKTIAEEELLWACKGNSTSIFENKPVSYLATLQRFY